MLFPSADQYIMRFSTVDYRVERRKHGRTEGMAVLSHGDCPALTPSLSVRMPSDQYSLDLTNTTVASLDRSLSRMTGLVIGLSSTVDYRVERRKHGRTEGMAVLSHGDCPALTPSLSLQLCVCRQTSTVWTSLIQQLLHWIVHCHV